MTKLVRATLLHTLRHPTPKITRGQNGISEVRPPPASESIGSSLLHTNAFTERLNETLEQNQLYDFDDMDSLSPSLWQGLRVQMDFCLCASG
jgi:hypothetical protein